MINEGNILKQTDNINEHEYSRFIKSIYDKLSSPIEYVYPEQEDDLSIITEIDEDEPYLRNFLKYNKSSNQLTLEGGKSTDVDEISKKNCQNNINVILNIDGNNNNDVITKKSATQEEKNVDNQPKDIVIDIMSDSNANETQPQLNLDSIPIELFPETKTDNSLPQVSLDSVPIELFPETKTDNSLPQVNLDNVPIELFPERNENNVSKDKDIIINI